MNDTGIQELLHAKRPEILRAAKAHGAGNVRVFGSVARGEAVAGSDVDLLVDLEAGRSLLDHAALVLELEGLLGCRVDVAVERGLRPRTRAEGSRPSVRRDQQTLEADSGSSRSRTASAA